MVKVQFLEQFGFNDGLERFDQFVNLFLVKLLVRFDVDDCFQHNRHVFNEVDVVSVNNCDQRVLELIQFILVEINNNRFDHSDV